MIKTNDYAMQVAAHKVNPLSIGPVKLDTPFILAPMAGITDAPFRRICKQEGASLVCTEMISAKGLYYNDKATERLLYMYEDEMPLALQIFGSDPNVMAFAADKLTSRRNAILDINMGCPVPKVVRNGDGAALLRNPELIGKIVTAVVKSAGKPVTVKIRLGWDDSSVNIQETAKIIEDAGACALTVHGRTREQYYSGKADWEMIRNIKKVIRIPLIGNGDVFSAQDALKMLRDTGCDFVMIARGAYGNPRIFRDAARLWRGLPACAPLSADERVEMVWKQFDMLCTQKGEQIAAKEIRKHLGWYFKGFPHAAELRRKSGAISRRGDLQHILENIRNSKVPHIENV